MTYHAAYHTPSIKFSLLVAIQFDARLTKWFLVQIFEYDVGAHIHKHTLTVTQCEGLSWSTCDGKGNYRAFKAYLILNFNLLFVMTFF